VTHSLGAPMHTSLYVLLPLTFVVGWSGTRTSRYIHHNTGSRGEVLFMLALCWTPFLVGLVVLLLILSGSRP
jgi:hypothetical protein